MDSRISSEYVSIESRRDRELLIVIFQKFYKFPHSFLYYLDAFMDEMRKRGRHLIQYFCQCGGEGNLNQWHKRVLILRALVCKNHTNSKFRGKGEKFDFSLILILDRLDYN